MEEPRAAGPTGSPPPDVRPVGYVDPDLFRKRLTVGTLGVLLVVLVIHLLQTFAAIFQPLFIAAFIAYLILPVHRWLTERGIRSKLAYGLILVVVLGVLFAVGRLVYSNVETLRASWPAYEKKLDRMLVDLQTTLPVSIPSLEVPRVSELFQRYSSQLADTLGTVLGTFVGFATGMVVVFVYLVFLIAEKFTFPDRIDRAFGSRRGETVMQVVNKINSSISNYLAIKTFIGFLTAVLTMLVLWAFEVPFVPTWGILIFLLNYIPYLGSIVATVPPLVVALLEYTDRPWVVLIIAALLILVQQVLGNFLEPKLLGKRLGVSPLLILLSLTFWGILWGVVGMILAVPLLMVLKITLDNIPETRPIAILMSGE